MTIPSITIRIDFDAAGGAAVSGTTTAGGELPTPMGGPGPGMPVGAREAPTPMAGVGPGAVRSTPPEPSLDIVNRRAAATTGGAPRPEGEPGAARQGK